MTISVEEAATILGISRGLAYDAARRGQIPVIRLGARRLRVPYAALMDSLQSSHVLRSDVAPRLVRLREAMDEEDWDLARHLAADLDTEIAQ